LNAAVRRSDKHEGTRRYEERHFRSVHRHRGCDRAVRIADISAKKYDIGATDTEIKIGQTVPFSGPASAYAGTGFTGSTSIRSVARQS